MYVFLLGNILYNLNNGSYDGAQLLNQMNKMPKADAWMQPLPLDRY